MKYLVWSNEHDSWWRDAHCGYTSKLEDAGRYTLKEAEEICIGANFWQNERSKPSESIVPDSKRKRS